MRSEDFVGRRRGEFVYIDGGMALEGVLVSVMVGIKQLRLLK